MLALNLKIDLMSSNPEYRGGKAVENAVLNLVTVPSITYRPKESKPTLGRWICSSVYIGKELSGTYYVTRIPSLDGEDPSGRRSPERYERDGYVRDRRVVNPVGLFFDSTTDPASDGFLTLYSFAPAEGQVDRGFGMFSRYDVNLVWSGLDWSRRSSA